MGLRERSRRDLAACGNSEKQNKERRDRERDGSANRGHRFAGGTKVQRGAVSLRFSMRKADQTLKSHSKIAARIRVALQIDLRHRHNHQSEPKSVRACNHQAIRWCATGWMLYRHARQFLAGPEVWCRS